MKHKSTLELRQVKAAALKQIKAAEEAEKKSRASIPRKTKEEKAEKAKWDKEGKATAKKEAERDKDLWIRTIYAKAKKKYKEDDFDFDSFHVEIHTNDLPEFESYESDYVDALQKILGKPFEVSENQDWDGPIIEVDW